ncbi:potassium channel family protein [Silanimonas sp.]|uniref:potassium channel family protein n=1 Tax=Silanimonas sp. TaxID=1929290 RepID=UPI0022BC3980|nr:potassium channel family protein [Silanimonas sp.]MCZ8166452.1 ion channel [Silanimonas sp.]
MRFVILRQLRRLPNLLLLSALLAQVLAWPWLEGIEGGRLMLVGFDWVILVLALRAARATGAEAQLGWWLLGPAVVLHAAEVVAGGSGLYVASQLAQAAFHGFVVTCLLRYVLRDDVMTLDELWALASLYVLLAFVFAYVYAVIEHLAPGAFFINPTNNPDGVTGWWELLYFSFTCLTSVGFGEITPVHDVARSVVMIQQVTGVLYLAIVISRLIGMQRRRPE